MLETNVKENFGKKLDNMHNKQYNRTIKKLFTYAENAMWFAESYGLVPEVFKCKTLGGKSCELVLQSNEMSFSSLPSSERTKLRELVHLLDRFKISDNAYHELSIMFGDMPRKYVIVQCRNDIKDAGSFNSEYLTSFLIGPITWG